MCNDIRDGGSITSDQRPVVMETVVHAESNCRIQHCHSVTLQSTLSQREADFGQVWAIFGRRTRHREDFYRGNHCNNTKEIQTCYDESETAFLKSARRCVLKGKGVRKKTGWDYDLTVAKRDA